MSTSASLSRSPASGIARKPAPARSHAGCIDKAAGATESRCRRRCRRRRRQHTSCVSSSNNGDAYVNWTKAVRDQRHHRRLGHLGYRRHLALVISTLLLARSAAGALRAALGAAAFPVSVIEATLVAAGAHGEGEAAGDAPHLLLGGVGEADRRILRGQGLAGARGGGGVGSVRDHGSTSAEGDAAGNEDGSTGVPIPEGGEAAAGVKRAARSSVPTSADTPGDNLGGGNGGGGEEVDAEDGGTAAQVAAAARYEEVREAVVAVEAAGHLLPESGVIGAASAAQDGVAAGMQRKAEERGGGMLARSVASAGDGGGRGEEGRARGGGGVNSGGEDQREGAAGVAAAVAAVALSKDEEAVVDERQASKASTAAAAAAAAGAAAVAAEAANLVPGADAGFGAGDVEVAGVVAPPQPPYDGAAAAASGVDVGTGERSNNPSMPQPQPQRGQKVQPARWWPHNLRRDEERGRGEGVGAEDSARGGGTGEGGGGGGGGGSGGDGVRAVGSYTEAAVAAETPPAAGATVRNETEAKNLIDAKVGLDSIRTIETEVQKHVEDLMALFTTKEKGGQRYQAAAVGVQQEVDDIRSELVKLLRTLNSTNAGILGAEHELKEKELELVQLKAIEEVEGAKDKLTGGKVKVDYATGNIRWDEEDGGDVKRDKGTGPFHGNPDGRGGEKAPSSKEEVFKTSVEWRKEIERMKEEWDPALLHLDSNLLRDFVVLCMSAAMGGVLAAGLGLPETLGYIVGGMVVGPSGVDVIRMVKEVETFAQFGSIFLLFGHGLTYSTFMNTGRSSAAVYAPQGRMGAFTVLFVVFSALLVCAAFIGIEDGVESVFLSAAATLSSTAMVTEFVAHSRLGDTVFAHMVVDLVAVQDLVMCPLLAIPTAIMYAVEESEGQTGSFVPRITGCAILLLAFVIASRSVLPVAMARLVLKDKTKEHSSGLFTLGVVSYCLGVALVCERLNLSHEAGALFAGLLMVDSPFAKKAHACMQPLTSLFGGMYLGSLGMIVNPAFIIWNFGDVLGCVLLLVFIKLLIVALVMKSFGFTWEASTLAGACMAQVSEISLFFVARAQHLQLIRRHHYLMAVATTIILMVASPLVIRGLQHLHGGGALGGSSNGTGDRVGGGGGDSGESDGGVVSGGDRGGVGDSPGGGGGGGGGGGHGESVLPLLADRRGSEGSNGSSGGGTGGGREKAGGGGQRSTGDVTSEAQRQATLRFRRGIP